MKEFGEIGTHSLSDSEISATSYFQLHLHFDDSAESIADSGPEDGEIQKMLTSPLYDQKASGKPDALVVQERREVSAPLTQAEKESLRSQSSEGQKASKKPECVCGGEEEEEGEGRGREGGERRRGGGGREDGGGGEEGREGAGGGGMCVGGWVGGEGEGREEGEGVMVQTVCMTNKSILASQQIASNYGWPYPCGKEPRSCA